MQIDLARRGPTVAAKKPDAGIGVDDRRSTAAVGPAAAAHRVDERLGAVDAGLEERTRRDAHARAGDDLVHGGAGPRWPRRRARDAVASAAGGIDAARAAHRWRPRSATSPRRRPAPASRRSRRPGADGRRGTRRPARRRGAARRGTRDGHRRRPSARSCGTPTGPAPCRAGCRRPAGGRCGPAPRPRCPASARAGRRDRCAATRSRRTRRRGRARRRRACRRRIDDARRRRRGRSRCHSATTSARTSSPGSAPVTNTTRPVSSRANELASGDQPLRPQLQNCHPARSVRRTEPVRWLTGGNLCTRGPISRVSSRRRTSHWRTSRTTWREPDTVVWVDLCNPDRVELEKLKEELGLHELAVEDALEPHQRPKLDHYDTHLFLSCHLVHLGAGRGDAWTRRRSTPSSATAGSSPSARATTSTSTLVVKRWDRSADLAVLRRAVPALRAARRGGRQLLRGHRPVRRLLRAGQRAALRRAAARSARVSAHDSMARQSLVKIHRLINGLREAVSSLLRRGDLVPTGARSVLPGRLRPPPAGQRDRPTRCGSW